jgi:hypothetical protein
MDADETHFDPPQKEIDQMTTEELIDHIEAKYSELGVLKRENAMLKQELVKLKERWGLVK